MDDTIYTEHPLRCGNMRLMHLTADGVPDRYMATVQVQIRQGQQVMQQQAEIELEAESPADAFECLPAVAQAAAERMKQDIVGPRLITPGMTKGLLNGSNANRIN